MKIESGCYNCKERVVGCHANCKKYKEYKEKKDVINSRRKLEEDFDRYVVSRRLKYAKSR